MRQDIKPYFVYPPVMMLALYMTVLGYMVPAIRAVFSLSLAQAGLFSTLQSIGSALSVVLCFSVFSGLNKTRVTALSSFLMAVSMVLFGLSEVVFMLYVLFFFLGLFANTVDTLSNAIVSDLSPHKKSFHIGVLQALWASSGAVGPFFAMMLGSAYRPVFLGLGILTALISLMFLIGLRNEAKMAMLQNRHNIGGAGKLLRTLKTKGLSLFVITNFFSSFAQIAFIFFISSYGESVRGVHTDGAFVLSAMFAGKIIGRILYAKYLCRLPARKFLPFANILAVSSFMLMLTSGDIITVCLLASIGGIGISANMPTIIVELCGLLPKDTSAASALVFLGYAFASFVAPPLIGGLGDTAGIGTALNTAAAVLLPVVVLSALLKGDKSQKRA